jgi:hypothetical protein
MVAPGTRRRVQARAKLRALSIVETALGGERSQPTDGQLNKVLSHVSSGKDWKEIFPGIASLELASDEGDYTVSLRLGKREGEPVRLVPEGTPGAMVVAVKRVDELGFYNMGLRQLASHVGLSGPRTLAVVQEPGLSQVFTPR